MNATQGPERRWILKVAAQSDQRLSVIVEVAEDVVVAGAQEPSDCPRLVVVVDVQGLPPGTPINPAADRTASVLVGPQDFVIVGR